MNEDLAKQLSSILNDKNIDLNQILDNFKANSSGENTENNNTQNNNNNTDSDTQNQNDNSGFGQFDMNTILKIQKLLSLMNNNRKCPRWNSIKGFKTIYAKLQKRKNRPIHKTLTDIKNVWKI